jgi:hypothetical protein
MGSQFVLLGNAKSPESGAWGYYLGMEITDYMVWKFVALVVAAFIAGFMGWLR